MVSDREYISENMPTLPQGYYFKVTRSSGDYQYVKLMRKRYWWRDKKLSDVIHRNGDLSTPDRIVRSMHNLMSIHGGNAALAADQGPKSRLTGRYTKHAEPIDPKQLTAALRQRFDSGDGIEYDEGTQTFTLSEEILERLKNGE